jgi:hypothetical protein
MEWFKINWQGAYPIETAHTKLEATGFGVYAIYEMKGKDAKLLYIGEVYWQNFGKRLQQHKRDWLFRVNGKVVIHFGTVGLPEGKRISHQKVLDVEGVLIHVLVPPFNTVSKHGYTGREIMIFNLGKIGTLQPIICEKELKALIMEVTKGNK